MIRPQPKPRRRVLDRIVEKRERDNQAQEFRRAVWLRDEGRCRHCGRIVIRTLEHVPNRGEVHHVKTRGAYPELRYDVNNAVLLCLLCHGRIQRHEIDL